MKQQKWIRILAVALAAAMLLSYAAFADEETGIYNLQVVNTAAVESAQIAENGEALQLTIKTEPGCYYLITVQNSDSELPTTENLFYINQKTAEDTALSLLLYPKKMTAGDYFVYLADNHDNLLTESIRFSYLAPPEPEYIPGDVDENGAVDAEDVLYLLRYTVGLVETLTPAQEKAADVDHSGAVDGEDVLMLLRYTVGLVAELN